jgi:hypothetical protein
VVVCLIVAQLAFFLQHSHGYPTDANQFLFLIGDSNLPYLRLLSYVHGPGSSGYESFSCTFDMVGVDFQSYAEVRGTVNAHGRSDASHRFGQGNGRSSVKESKGLLGSVVNRHPCFQEVFADFGEFNADHFGQRTGRQFVQSFEGRRGMKYSHVQVVKKLVGITDCD